MNRDNTGIFETLQKVQYVHSHIPPRAKISQLLGIIYGKIKTKKLKLKKKTKNVGRPKMV